MGGPPPIKGYRERVREWIQERKEKRSRDRQKKLLGPGVAKVPKVQSCGRAPTKAAKLPKKKN